MSFKPSLISRSQWLLAFVLLGIMLATTVFLLSETLAIVFPIGDEWALIMSSQEGAIKWITEGYSNYFRVFDEYFVPLSDFIRPVANLLYSIFSYTSSPSKYQLIFVNYLLHAAICTLIYLMCLSFGNNNKFSLAVTSIAFLAPAFWLTEMVAYPSHAFDGLAALFCLLSLAALLKGHYLVGFLFLILGIYTKETALPMVAVWLVFGIQRNSLIAISYCILSIILWITVRLIAYDGSIGGTYTFNEFSLRLFLLRLSSLVTIPLANFSIDSFKELILAPGLSVDIFYLSVNIAVWLLSLMVIIKSGIKFWNPWYLLRTKSDLLIILIALAGSICFYFLIGGDDRFSYFTFAIWLIFLGAIKKSKERLLIVSLLLCSSIISFPTDIYHVPEIQKFKYNQSKSFVNFVSEQKFAGNTYVFNEFVSENSRQQFIANYSGATSNFYRGSTIDIWSCNSSELKLIHTKILLDKLQNRLIQIKLPPCAKFRFEAANADKLLLNIEGNILFRNDDISYKFRDLAINKTQYMGRPDFDFGRHLEITVSPNVNLVYFNFLTGSWEHYNKL